MKRLAAVFSVVAAMATGIVAAGQEPTADQRRVRQLAEQAASMQRSSAAEQRALRTRLGERFDIVAVTDGIALRPKSPMDDVRLIDVTGGTILVNGAAVTGEELRRRIGTETANAVMQLSYLTPEAQRALAGAGDVPVEEPRTVVVEPTPPVILPGEMERGRHSRGDRVRVFGDVTVREDESLTGQVVAVLGSVKIDGAVGDQVVSVLGSVDLGPKAIVRGDVVSVGGRVRRAEGAQVRGSVTEVAITEPNVHLNFEPLVGWGFWPFDGFSAVPRLVGSTLRFLLLVMLASIAFVVARPTVEASATRVSDSPVQSTFIGLAAQFLLVPAIVLTSIVLAISIIGIPLLLLIPFVIILLLLVALVGFSGVVVAVGRWARRRMGMAAAPPVVDILLGLLVLLLPVLVARFIALAGWPATPLAVMLLILGFAVEFFAWSSGFGAVLANAFTKWQARRNSRTIVHTPPPVAP